MSEPTSPAESLFAQFTLHAAADPDAPPAPVAVIDSEQLLAGRDVVHIRHQGALYQLRATRQGKLILTK